MAGDFDRRLEELRGSLRREAEHARCWEAGRRGEVQERHGKKWVGLKSAGEGGRVGCANRSVERIFSKD